MINTTIPVHILSGFLGSGKTTLLNQLLKLPQMSGTLVIVNEFGDVALDHLLIEKSCDEIIELSNGCLCCSIRGELIDTLQRVIHADCRRIIIETTGIADPLPIMQAIGAHPELSTRLRLAPTIVLYDLILGELILEQHEAAQRQLALGDIVLLSKGDLVAMVERPKRVECAEAIINRYNPGAPRFELPAGLQHLPKLLDKPVIQVLPKTGPDRAQTHSGIYKSISLSSATAVHFATIAGFIDHVLRRFGDKILRIKGLVLTREQPNRPLVVQVCGHLVHSPEYLAVWPEATEQTRLVVIVKDIDPVEITRLFDSFTGIPAIDTPDFTALVHNPLAVPGFKGP